VAGALKSVYDVALYVWFRRIPLPSMQGGTTDEGPA
jgi:hypothetical protein